MLESAYIGSVSIIWVDLKIIALHLAIDLKRMEKKRAAMARAICTAIECEKNSLYNSTGCILNVEKK